MSGKQISNIKNIKWTLKKHKMKRELQTSGSVNGEVVVLRKHSVEPQESIKFTECIKWLTKSNHVWCRYTQTDS